jgi:hypothetical protein
MEWMRLGPMLKKISGCAPKAKLFHKPVERTLPSKFEND